MVPIIVSSFYKYIDLLDPESFQKEHQEFCNALEIKGKVLVAQEGINGSVSGTKEQIKEYEEKLNSYKEFSDLTFKRTLSSEHPFKKTIVRIREEIVTSKLKVDPKKTGKYITPLALKKLYDTQQDFLLLDARNAYESAIGRFKNAITPNIDIFRDFPKVLSTLQPYKEKKIVLYCTGGVRCEKASAFLLKEGFKDVHQIEGGIINYITQFPDTYFEGRCFVFDDRLSVPTGEKTKDISLCEKCHVPCSLYINCSNISCDRLFLCCDSCKIEFQSTCSKICKNSSKRFK